MEVSLCEKDSMTLSHPGVLLLTKHIHISLPGPISLLRAAHLHISPCKAPRVPGAPLPSWGGVQGPGGGHVPSVAGRPFCPSSPFSHSCIRMKGSRPFCVSLAQGLGRDSMSLTLP